MKGRRAAGTQGLPAARTRTEPRVNLASSLVKLRNWLQSVSASPSMVELFVKHCGDEGEVRGLLHKGPNIQRLLCEGRTPGGEGGQNS